MNKKNKILIVCITICVIVVGILIWKISIIKADKTSTNADSNVIYSNTFFFSMGSRRLKIYDNGDVYDDLEIEEPNHKENYKKLKTLSNDEINELKVKIENETNKESLEEYVKILVYGSTSISPLPFNER